MDILEQHAKAEVFCIELIIEFLVYHNFQNTLNVLKKEVEQLNIYLPNPFPKAKERINKSNVPLLMKLLDSNDHIAFFEKWISLIPNEIKGYTEYKKLTIYLYAYFATIKYRECLWDECVQMNNVSECSPELPLKDNEYTTGEIIPINEIKKKNGTFIIEKPVHADSLPIVEEDLSLEENNEIRAKLETRIEDEDSSNREFETDSLDNVTDVESDTIEIVKKTNIEDSAMNMFKSFLSENGSEFSNDPEFLPFFALPFVQNPKLHPSFTKIFEDSWLLDLKQTVKQFLINYSCGDTVIPQILKLYLNSDSVTVKSKEGHSSSQLDENTRKLKEAKRKLHKLKKDHQKLVGVASELSSALEKSVQGEAVNLKCTLTNCIKIFPDLFSISQNPLNQSIKWHTCGNTIEEKKLNYNEIDIKKVKYDLVHASVKTKLLILQSLRWLITKCRSEEREQIVSWFCRQDLLGLKTSFISDSLAPANSPHPVQQSVVRILNALSSFNTGRDYISSSKITVQLLIDITKQKDLDSVTEDMVVAALQKLSLRRKLVDLMINNNILDWLLTKLETGPMKKYTLEYCTSLIMNLSIFIPVSFWDSRELNVYCLIKLLKTPHKQVVEFVCGTLCCIVRSDTANTYCRNYELHKFLTECLDNHKSNVTIEKQIDTLIRLHQREIAPDKLEMNTSFYSSDDDLDDPEELESEIDENDLVKGNPSGESLLTEQYCLIFTTPSIVVGKQFNRSPKLMLRPTTPKSSNIPSWARIL